MMKKPEGYSFDTSDNWVQVYKFINVILSWGVTVLRDEKSFFIPFDIIAGTNMACGLIREEIDKVEKLAEEYKVKLDHIEALPSGELLSFSSVRVGVFGGGGAPYNYGYGLSELGFDVYYIDDRDIRGGILSNLDIFIVPGGGFRAMYGQLQPLGVKGINEIMQFVRGGGMYIGSCAGSYDAAITPKSFTDTFPLQTNMQMINAKVWNDGSNTEWAGLQSPGIGVIKVKKAVKCHPILWDMPDEFEIAHYNGPIFETVDNSSIEGSSKALGLLSWSGYTEAFTPSERFLDNGYVLSELLADKAINESKFAAVLGFLDKGSVLLFGSHPEFGFSITMGDMQLSYKIIANAILWKSAIRRKEIQCTKFDEIYLNEYSSNALYKSDELIELVKEKLEEVSTVMEKIDSKSKSPSWLDRAYSMSLFGKEPSLIWDETMKENKIIIKDMLTLMEEMSDIYREAFEKGNCKELTNVYRMWQSAILYNRDDLWDQDFGYQGVVKLLDMSKNFFTKAYERYDLELSEKPGNPYSQMFENPYILAVGVYCSASGAIASAQSIMKMHKAKLEKYLIREKISAS